MVKRRYQLKSTISNVSSFDVADLNQQQQDAVLHQNGPILVLAGAGTGKTKTLVYRVARLIHDGVNPKQILLLTFTRKSSQEMLKRAASILDNRCQQVAGGTLRKAGADPCRGARPYPSLRVRWLHSTT